mmetsp:Transcript_8843/g.16689  ORF Transcript_8843/g.16689 Transcript_8843/m.16689 type:complete len:186 (+) Transcript_8843:1795-2352(+)
MKFYIAMTSLITSKPTNNNKVILTLLFFLWQCAIARIVDATVPCFIETLDRAIFAATILRSGDRSGVGYVDEVYGAIETWCFDSGLTDFSSLFQYNMYFNTDVSGWDVSFVTNMRLMFSGTSAFDKDIGGWNVSSVVDMGRTVSSLSMILMTVNNYGFFVLVKENHVALKVAQTFFAADILRNDN